MSFRVHRTIAAMGVVIVGISCLAPAAWADEKTDQVTKVVQKSVNDLPLEILAVVSQYLSPKDLNNFRQVDSAFHQLVTLTIPWKKHVDSMSISALISLGMLSDELKILTENTLKKKCAFHLVAGMPGNAGCSPGIVTQGQQTKLDSPIGVATGAQGNVYISDTENHVVRKVDAVGKTTIVAGSPGHKGSWSTGLAAQTFLNSPGGIAVDSQDNLYIADTYNHVVRKVDPKGTTTIVAGVLGRGGYDGSAHSSLATETLLNLPEGVDVDAQGNVYIADTWNHVVRKVKPDGTIAIVAGTQGLSGYSPDRVVATAAMLNVPADIAVDAHGNVYIADNRGQAVRKVDTYGTMTIVAGRPLNAYNTSDDTIPQQEKLSYPHSLAVDTQGNVYVADSSHHVVRKIDINKNMTTIAGVFEKNGCSSEGSIARQALLNHPAGIAVDDRGKVYISDMWNHAVWSFYPES